LVLNIKGKIKKIAKIECINKYEEAKIMSSWKQNGIFNKSSYVVCKYTIHFTGLYKC
jgi:hypothetical protein